VNQACVRFRVHRFLTDPQRIPGYGKLLHLWETNDVPLFDTGGHSLVASKTVVQGAADLVSGPT